MIELSDRGANIAAIAVVLIAGILLISLPGCKFEGREEDKERPVAGSKWHTKLCGPTATCE